MSAAKPKVIGFGRSPGNTIAPSKAEPYGRELLRIERERGDLQNKTIVAAARPKGSVLHDAFTWDDTAAAEKWREDEARHLKQAITVTLRYADGHELVAPLTIALHFRDERTRGNRVLPQVESVVRVITNPEKAAQAVSECMASLVALRRRYDCLTDAVGGAIGKVWEAVDEAQQRLALDKTG